MGLPWCWCKVCSLCGQGYAHTEGAELACDKTQKQIYIG